MVTTDEMFETITKTWDTLVMPTPPNEFGNDQTTYDYVNALCTCIEDLAKRANEYEAKAQRLADANIRQTNIILKLRQDLQDIRTQGVPALDTKETEDTDAA